MSTSFWQFFLGRLKDSNDYRRNVARIIFAVHYGPGKGVAGRLLALSLKNGKNDHRWPPGSGTPAGGNMDRGLVLGWADSEGTGFWATLGHPGPLGPSFAAFPQTLCVDGKEEQASTLSSFKWLEDAGQSPRSQRRLTGGPCLRVPGLGWASTPATSGRTRHWPRSRETGPGS